MQRHGGSGAFAVDAGPLGLGSSGGRPMPEAVRGQMEAALGADFSAVRVHVGPQAEHIGAIAFTTGNDIYFAPGRYQPHTTQGQQLLGHELAHVMQQRAGRVRNPLGDGVAIVQDRALEAEADRIGRHAATQVLRAEPSPLAGPSATILRNRGPIDGSSAIHGARYLTGPVSAASLGGRKSLISQRKGAIQRQPIVNAQVTGLTHLREASKEYPSLVRGSDYGEIEYPDTVTVDLGDVWDSHLGMNLAVSPSPTNVWYRVVAHNGFPLEKREVYIRAEMIRSLGPIPIKKKVLKGAQESLTRAKKGDEYNRELAYQSLGDVWEAYLLPLMKARRGGSTLYWGLRYIEAELDFVFISTNVVKIVSAKIRRRAYNPSTDKKHWTQIRDNWDAAITGKEVKVYGNPISLPPGTEPIVTCESLETQGLSPEQFEEMIGLTGIPWIQSAPQVIKPPARRLAEPVTIGPGPDASHKKDLWDRLLKRNQGTTLEPIITSIHNREYTHKQLGTKLIGEWTFQQLSGAKELANFQSGVGELFLKEKLTKIYPALTTDVDRTPWLDVDKATLPNPDYQVKGTHTYIDAVLIKSAKSPADAKQQAIKADKTKREKYNKHHVGTSSFVYWTAAFCLVPMKMADLTAATTTTPHADTKVHLFFLDSATGKFAYLNIP